MSKDTKDTLENIGAICLVLVLFIGVGFMAGQVYELHHTTDINKQHEELVLENNYNYCPYCGEKLNKE